MSNHGTLAAIDVGTTKTCSIIANISDGRNLRILGVGIEPSKGLNKGVVVNLEETKNSIRESVRKAQRSCGLRMDSAFVGITGRHINSINNKGMVAIAKGDKRVSNDDLRRVISSASTVNVPNDRRILHTLTRHYTLDGQPGVKNPIGMHGLRLDVESHVVTASAAPVQNLVKCVRGAGIEVEDLVLEALASAEAVLSPDEMDAGVLMLDIGGGTTDIAVFKDGSIWHSAVLPVGGTQITRDISIGLGIPYDIAEELKKKYGNLLLSSVNQKAEIKDICLGGDGHSIMQQDLCEIIRARVEEMLRMALLELPRSEYLSLLPAGVVLTGGVSNLPGIDVLTQEVFRLPARTGQPKDMFGLAEILYDPAYATGVGLAWWGARHAHEAYPLGKSFPDKITSSIRHALFQAKRSLAH